MTSHSLKQWIESVALQNGLMELVDSGGFDKVLDKLEIISVGKGTCLCEMRIHKKHQNQGGFLHGGMISTLVDSVSTLALLQETQKPGVSVEMSISFLRPAAVGETVIIETNAVNVGKDLAFLTVDLKSKTTGKLIAQGKHTKYFNDWVPCRDENNPKTIDQIHKEAEREAHEQQQMLQQMPDDRDRQKNRPPMSEDGRNMSGKSGKGSYSFEPKKIKLAKPAEVKFMQLGPGGKFSTLARGISGGTKSSSIEQDSRPATLQNNRSAASSLESSNNGEAITVLEKTELTVPEIEKKTKPLIDEFLHNSDLEEAVEAVRRIVELADPSTLCVFVNSAVNHVVERSSQSRHMLGKLLHALLKRKIITMDQYNEGLEEILEFVDDYALEIPLIEDYLGEIMAPILDDDYISLTFLKDTLKPCIPSQIAGKIVSAVLICASKKRGMLGVDEMWKESKLSWSDFLESGADVEDFVKSHKLKYTTKPVAEPKLRKPITPEELKQHLPRLLRDHESNEEIFDWLERHIEDEISPLMYRTLVTVIHESVITGAEANCELNGSKLKERMCILTWYKGLDQDLELNAIFALQCLMNKLGHPKGILLQIFELAYNGGFLSEEVFKEWEHCDDPAEQEGKGVAIHSVSSFFTWLHEESEEGD